MSSAYSKPFELADVPDLTGKVALVTGANRGMGLEMAHRLAEHGARVYTAVRSPQQGKAALDACTWSSPEVRKRVTPVELDLADVESIKSLASQLLAPQEQGGPAGHLDILINNAAVSLQQYALTKQGLEIHIGVNLIGIAALTYLLLPLLARTGAQKQYHDSSSSVRIVNLASSVAAMSPAHMVRDYEQTLAPPPRWWHLFSTWKRYAASKLAVFVWTAILSRSLRQAGLNITALAVHPGSVKTGFQASPRISWAITLLMDIVTRFFDTVEDGTRAPLCAATSPLVDQLHWKGDETVLKPMGVPTHITDKAVTGLAGDPTEQAEVDSFLRSNLLDKAGIDADWYVERARQEGGRT